MNIQIPFPVPYPQQNDCLQMLELEILEEVLQLHIQDHQDYLHNRYLQQNYLDLRLQTYLKLPKP